MEAAAASTEICGSWLERRAPAGAGRRPGDRERATSARNICSARATRAACREAWWPAGCCRALKNLLETYPAFIALALALVVTGKTGGIGATGAWLWLLARVVYVVLYAAGIPVVRTLVWIASILGLVLMLIRLMA